MGTVALLLMGVSRLLHRARAQQCGATDLGKAVIVFELCFDDEINGISTPHAHLASGTVYDADLLRNCVENTDDKLGGDSLSSGCLGCLTTGSITTEAGYLACFSSLHLTSTHSCGAQEAAALQSLQARPRHSSALPR